MTPDRFIVTDPQGRQVRLTAACYLEHILIDHPDLSDDSEIEEAIRRAEVITIDIVDHQRLVYYRTYRRTPTHWLLKVVVERDEVITAYRVNRIKQGEKILWRR